jgi:Na+/H+ antiporter NhaD/arsenite permease-like protein
MVSGLLSAFLVNDTVCLVMTPLVLDLVRRLGRDPIPYLMAIPMASNVGRVATITGNPQNMMISSFSHIPNGAFAGAIWPVAITAALSNVVSNVPAVLFLKPFVAGAGDPQRAWLVVAMASTLAGNFTLIGSVANLIVAQKARREGVDLDFWSYFRIGAPLTVATILFGVWWL